MFERILKIRLEIKTYESKNIDIVGGCRKGTWDEGERVNLQRWEREQNKEIGQPKPNRSVYKSHSFISVHRPRQAGILWYTAWLPCQKLERHQVSLKGDLPTCVVVQAGHGPTPGSSIYLGMWQWYLNCVVRQLCSKTCRNSSSRLANIRRLSLFS